MTSSIIAPPTPLIPSSNSERHLDRHNRSVDWASSDSTSSNGASPTTPFYERSFNFSYSHYEQAKSDETMGDPTNSKLHDTDIPLQKSSQHHHPPTQKNQSLYQRSVANLIPSTERMHACTKKTTMPVDMNCSGDSIVHEKGDDPTLWNQENGDTVSLADSSSIDCEDFPNPPSSTPSLVQRLPIKTNTPRQHDKTSSLPIYPRSSGEIATISRFTEVFDIGRTELELDYNTNYRHHRITSPSTCSHKMNTLMDQQGGIPASANGGQNKRIGNFINTISRTVALSSAAETSVVSSSVTTTKSKKRTLSTSSGSHSIRGLIRNLSTSATNRNHPPATKHSAKQTQNAAATETTASDQQPAKVFNDNDTSATNTMAPIEGRQRRRKISSLLSNVILKMPTKRRPIKITEPLSTPSTKKLARRTVIYVNSDSRLDVDDFLENIHQYYQHSSSDHYRLAKKLPPSPPACTASARSSTLYSQSSSDISSTRSPSNKQTTRKSTSIEGLELWEMDDGTIEWGLVMEEGQRHLMLDQQPKVDGDDDRQMYFNADEDKGSENNQIERRETWTVMEEKLPSPIVPRLTPGRKLSNALSFMPSPSNSNCGTIQSTTIAQDNESSSSTTASSLSSTTTEIYFADMTLPSLLHAMSQKQKSNCIFNHQI